MQRILWATSPGKCSAETDRCSAAARHLHGSLGPCTLQDYVQCSSQDLLCSPQRGGRYGRLRAYACPGAALTRRVCGEPPVEAPPLPLERRSLPHHTGQACMYAGYDEHIRPQSLTAIYLGPPCVCHIDHIQGPSVSSVLTHIAAQGGTQQHAADLRVMTQMLCA